MSVGILGKVVKSRSIGGPLEASAKSCFCLSTTAVHSRSQGSPLAMRWIPLLQNLPNSLKETLITGPWHWQCEAWMDFGKVCLHYWHGRPPTLIADPWYRQPGNVTDKLIQLGSFVKRKSKAFSNSQIEDGRQTRQSKQCITLRGFPGQALMGSSWAWASETIHWAPYRVIALECFAKFPWLAFLNLIVRNERIIPFFLDVTLTICPLSV